jgi:hypothetical protein
MKYKAVLKSLGSEWTATGKTIEEALANLDLSWEQIKGKGTLTVSWGKDSHEHLFNVFVLRRIVSNDIIRAHWAKYLGIYLKGGKTSNIPIHQ